MQNMGVTIEPQPVPRRSVQMTPSSTRVTFCVRRFWSECWNLYQMDLRTEAKGVTPIPAPTSMATSYWKTSSLAVPKGPSTLILQRQDLSRKILAVSSAYLYDALRASGCHFQEYQRFMGQNLEVGNPLKSPKAVCCLLGIWHFLLGMQRMDHSGCNPYFPGSKYH